MKKIERFTLEFLKDVIENGENHPYVNNKYYVSLKKIHQGFCNCTIEELFELREHFKKGYSSVSNMFFMQMIDGISLQPLYVSVEARSPFLQFEGITLEINLALDSGNYSLNTNNEIIQSFLLEKVRNVCGMDVSELNINDCGLLTWVKGEMEKQKALLFGISFNKDIFPTRAVKILKLDNNIETIQHK
jgi:hypothetical protein